MTSALVPIWILGAPLIALIVLSSMFQSGTSAMSERVTRPRDVPIRG
jgi:hypothetical protein